MDWQEAYFKSIFNNAEGASATPVSCDECKTVYNEMNEEPPCEGCQLFKPELHEDNLLAWNVWNRLNRTRQRKPIVFQRSKKINGNNGSETVIRTFFDPLDITKAIPLLEMYDGTVTDFEKIEYIESRLFPQMNQQGSNDGH